MGNNLTHSPFAEISILGDFNVHHQLWLSSSFLALLAILLSLLTLVILSQPFRWNFRCCLRHLESIGQSLAQIFTYRTKLPSYRFCSSLCTFISNFLTGPSISAVVVGNCSKHKPINSGVLQGSVLLPTLFQLFINDLSITECPIHSYADDSTLHYSATFKSRPSQIEIHNARLDATEHMASDFSIISDWGRRIL